MDEELRGLSFQSLQTLIVDFPEWRQDVLAGFTQFLAKEVQDTSPQLVENGLRMLLQLLTSWRNGEPGAATAPAKSEPLAHVIRGVEALALVMLCQCRAYPRRLAQHVLRYTRALHSALRTRRHLAHSGCSSMRMDRVLSKLLLEKLQLTHEEPALIDAADAHVPQLTARCLPLLPPAEKQALLAAAAPDLAWLVERTHAVWTAGLQHDETSSKNSWSGSASSGADPWEVWKYYMMMAYLVVPAVPSPVIRCASPDLSLRYAHRHTDTHTHTHT
ncbi:Protein furry-like protein-like [Operophtera brumata]|uniref:Protein furry-like protein-like n=1 Tax=Operophtera brumata TaxID=104452 RepID=A0A0L7LQV8_OPEBR|nr:Protein furry-like protein-like [Operophtera brumata]